MPLVSRDHPTGETLTRAAICSFLPRVGHYGSSGLLPCPPSVDPVFGISSPLRTRRTLVTQLSMTSSAQEREQIRSCQLAASDSLVLWTQSHRCCLLGWDPDSDILSQAFEAVESLPKSLPQQCRALVCSGGFLLSYGLWLMGSARWQCWADLENQAEWGLAELG